MKLEGNVALVYGHGESVKSVFMASVIHNVLLDDRCAPLIGAVHGQGGGIIARVRNDAVRWFMDETDLPWLWFVDADMKVAWYTLPEMLETIERADLGPCVATAATNGLVEGGPRLTWLHNGDHPLEAPFQQQLTEIEACGMACTLIHREVLSAVAAQHALDPWPWFGHDIVGDHRLGEDYTFCYRARGAGYSVYGVDVPVQHYKLLPI